MLSWVVKVVPQPPEPPPKKTEELTEAPPPTKAPPPVIEKKVKFQDEVKYEAPKPEKPKQEVQPAAGNGPAPPIQPNPQSGVLSWISGALPQPPVSPNLNRANSTTKEETSASNSNPEDEIGMIAWISQGLEKVVPQPEIKSKESAGGEQPSEVRPAAAPEPVVTVVNVESDREDGKPFPPSMMDWIKQGIEKVVPQPEIYIRAKAEEKHETPAAKTAEAPVTITRKPSIDLDRSTKEIVEQPNMIGWIKNGIGRMLPQPILKQDATSGEVQSRGKGGLSPLK